MGYCIWYIGMEWCGWRITIGPGCDHQVTLLHPGHPGDLPAQWTERHHFHAGWRVYVGSGENCGPPDTASATDGKKAPTPRAEPMFSAIRRDGSQLETYATGLWNAFVLTTDGTGQVFACDNDPDSRPPCRFLHIVKGADFGYQFQYGRSGLHPFVSWNGELPGTLPMMAGTGKRRTGILDARLAKLGPERGDGFLITEWGDSTVSWFRLQPQGASFTPRGKW